ncbi:ribose 5-phosphate isomerase B [Thermaurantimonas aggregans]|uniref:Ribose 5-phosphate isomerase B n=1 Tax=Thermaurantimonas aggregans TaxID=2173829 RepID=A0A401XMR7_9FLAO|nr:ribose 5-phosphate isomerase B [Thermaurantimonas aggregans]MCX8149401.1 ribose 5-phosphate isomerase B [Thermaurantimonas aggregans]GCD78304.1 ribose 5-phosphate isomerase B [Thermaurantimonas aggregans]
MKLAIASDHAGFELKEFLKNTLDQYEIIDVGCFSSESVDYPDYGHRLAELIEKGEVSYGIAICGSGNGINMTVNKHPGIRGALCWDVEIARLARAHNNANIISLPARFISKENALNFVRIFLETPFEGGRHSNRIKKIPCF